MNRQRDSTGYTLFAFDENLIRTSPAGSCMLKVLESAAGRVPLHLFFNRLDMRPDERIRTTRIPLPPGPVLLRSILFTLFASAAYFCATKPKPSVRLTTQGVFPFCDISYAHFCHYSFLKNHRAALGGGFFRRGARILTHILGAVTERIAFSSARTIVVPSKGLARELLATYPDLVANKLQIIPNPVDVQAFAKRTQFSAAAVQSEAGAEPDDLVLCFCALGNFERKGLRFIFEALAKLPAARAKLIVVGGSPGEIQTYRKLAEKLSVRSRVYFAGLQDDIRPYFWSSHIFLFPSVYEIFPLVCLQAAAAGLPLITTPLYGVEEFMVNGKTGWIVEATARSVASAIEDALENPACLRAMGREARERVQIYNEVEFGERWRSLLEREQPA